jgi:Beta-galactosidase
MALALVALLSGTAVQSAQAKRRVPFGFFGTVLDPVMTDPTKVPDQALDSQMGLMARSGVESVRVTMEWGIIEPSPNKFDFSSSDRIVASAARHGLHLLVDVLDTPKWASTRPGSALYFRYAPRRAQDFANFMTALVRRYGPHGSYWKANRGLKSDPVRQWQIWNEEGFNVFWATLPWPRSYTSLLRAAYKAIHGADHGATVVPGSIVDSGVETQWAEMQDLYRAGAKRYFDVVAVHPFTQGNIPVSQSIGHAVTIMQMVRDVMRRHGDGHKPMFITEITWPAARGFVKPSRLIGTETTPQGEILRLRAAYNYFATHIRQLGVTQVDWFTWASNFNANDPASDVSYRFAGLVRFTGGVFTPLPILRTYSGLAAHYEGCHKGNSASGRC